MHPERPNGAGAVIWITGLPASGKSTVARAVVERLRAADVASVLLDGDELRGTIAPDLGYGLDDRRRCAERYAKLAMLLASQGLHVVVATISMFAAVRAWTRAHAPRYVEVYLDVSEPERRARDHRGIHRERDVVGVDLPYEPPTSADVVARDDSTVEATADRILSVLASGTTTH